MVPSGPHAGPYRMTESAIVWTGPPARSTRLILLSAMNPIDRPSGDQNGWAACSVPGIGRASSWSRARTQRIAPVDSPVATNATSRPSGEIVAESCGVTAPGAESETRRTSAGADGREPNDTYQAPATTSARPASAIQRRGDRVMRHRIAAGGTDGGGLSDSFTARTPVASRPP